MLSSNQTFLSQQGLAVLGQNFLGQKPSAPHSESNSTSLELGQILSNSFMMEESFDACVSSEEDDVSEMAFNSLNQDQTSHGLFGMKEHHTALDLPMAMAPSVEIVEQPQSKGVRFRYACEGPLAGALPGCSSGPGRKTVPSIKITNYSGPAAIVVSCVTADPPHQPHPHKLVSKVCRDGVLTSKVKNTAAPISFNQLGIQCVKRRDIEASLKHREKIQVDPFNTGYCPTEKQRQLDLKCVRLCFQVFLDGPSLGFPDSQFIPLPAIVTNKIYDRSADTNDLIIYKLSSSSCPANGGREMILLCERVDRRDIQVRFFEIDEYEEEVWSEYARFSPDSVHKRVAISFTVPPYRDPGITESRLVYLELRKPSTKETSGTKNFNYTPIRRDHYNPDMPHKFAKTDLGHDGRKASEFVQAYPILQELMKDELIDSDISSDHNHNKWDKSYVT